MYLLLYREKTEKKTHLGREHSEHGLTSEDELSEDDVETADQCYENLVKKIITTFDCLLNRPAVPVF